MTSTTAERIAIVIQAGGRSSRMAQDHPVDKALIPFLGKPMILRIIDRLRALGSPICVVTNRPEAYAFLDVPLVSDVQPGAGPLGGFFSAFSKIEYPLVAMVACDMPFLSANLLKAQFNLLEQEGTDGVVPHSAEGLEPLHGVYRRDRCLPAVRAALERGERRVISWFPAVRMREMTATEMEEYDPGLRSIMNVNTRDEFQQAEALARKLEGI
jgi:molybdopterin-guanine dinucleotide biosynthesis protein A